jgi:hypothetical protein
VTTGRVVTFADVDGAVGAADDADEDGTDGDDVTVVAVGGCAPEDPWARHPETSATPAAPTSSARRPR